MYQQGILGGGGGGGLKLQYISYLVKPSYTCALL
jgi:hypothetical protein